MFTDPTPAVSGGGLQVRNEGGKANALFPGLLEHTLTKTDLETYESHPAGSEKGVGRIWGLLTPPGRWDLL